MLRVAPPAAPPHVEVRRRTPRRWRSPSFMAAQIGCQAACVPGSDHGWGDDVTRCPGGQAASLAGGGGGLIPRPARQAPSGRWAADEGDRTRRDGSVSHGTATGVGPAACGVPAASGCARSPRRARQGAGAGGLGHLIAAATSGRRAARAPRQGCRPVRAESRQGGRRRSVRPARTAAEGRVTGLLPSAGTSHGRWSARPLSRTIHAERPHQDGSHVPRTPMAAATPGWRAGGQSADDEQARAARVARSNSADRQCRLKSASSPGSAPGPRSRSRRTSSVPAGPPDLDLVFGRGDGTVALSTSSAMSVDDVVDAGPRDRSRDSLDV